MQDVLRKRKGKTKKTRSEGPDSANLGHVKLIARPQKYLVSDCSEPSRERFFIVFSIKFLKKILALFIQVCYNCIIILL